MQNWKTTVQGLLGLISVIGLAVISVQVPTALATPTLTHYWLILVFVVTIISAVAKAVIGFTQNDAKTVSEIAQKIVEGGGLAQTASAAPPETSTK